MICLKRYVTFEPWPVSDSSGRLCSNSDILRHGKPINDLVKAESAAAVWAEVYCCGGKSQMEKKQEILILRVALEPGLEKAGCPFQCFNMFRFVLDGHTFSNWN